MKFFKSWSTILVLSIMMALIGGRAWSQSTLPPVYQWNNPLTGASIPLDENWQIIIDRVRQEKGIILDLEFNNAKQGIKLAFFVTKLPVPDDEIIDQNILFDMVVTSYVNATNDMEKKFNSRGQPFKISSNHDVIIIENKNIGRTHMMVEYLNEQRIQHGYMFYFPDNHNRSWILEYRSNENSSAELALQIVTPFIHSIIDTDTQAPSDLPTFIPGTYEEAEHYPPAQQVVQSIRQKGVQAPYQWQNPFTGHIIPVETGWKLASNTDSTQCADHDLAGFAESFCFIDATSNIALSLKRRAPQPLNPYGMVMIGYRNQGEQATAQNDALAYAVSMQSFGPYQLPLLQYSDKATGKPQSYKVSFDTLKTMWEIEIISNLEIEDWRLSHMITLLFASTQEESDIDAQEWNTLQPLPVVEN